jgi:imidazolonepropionase-like amidohydrolase
VTPLEAVQAITISAANRHGERESKGSLEPGKLAGLVVETIKEGRTTYSARPSQR